MSKRINVMIDEDVWRVLGRMTAGARSRAVNEALRAWVQRLLRQDAVRELDALRERLPAVSTAEVVRWIREDRRATVAALKEVDTGALVAHGDVDAWVRGLRSARKPRDRA